MTMTALPAALRACARGIHVHKASAELLIGHARWLERQDFTGPFIHASASHAMAAINRQAAITA